MITQCRIKTPHLDRRRFNSVEMWFDPDLYMYPSGMKCSYSSKITNSLSVSVSFIQLLPLALV